LQETHEVAIRLNGHELRVAVHTAQDLAGERADTRPVFHDHAGTGPVDRVEHLIHEEARARDDRAEHVGMTQKVAREQQRFAERLERRSGIFWHDEPLSSG